MIAANTPVLVAGKTATPHTFRRILVAVNRRTGWNVIEQAARLATRDRSRVTLIHLQERTTLPSKTRIAVERETYEEALSFASMVQAELRELGVAAQCQVGREVSGCEASQILQAAADFDAELVIVGSSRKSRLEVLLRGSTAKDLARRTKVPVLVVPDERPLQAA